jgi:hypothetical protein
MATKIVAPMALLLTLAACGGPSVSLTNATPEEVAKAAEANGLKPTMRAGMWETTVEITEYDIAGMPAEMKAAALAKAKEDGKKKPSKYCLSEEESKKPGGMFTGAEESTCTYSKFEMSGGKIDMVMVCPGPGGQNMTMSVNGTFNGDSATAVTSVKSTGQFGMNMKANTVSKRTGDCTPDAKK